MVKIKQLPISDRTHTKISGKVIEGRPVFLYCRICGARFSATRGDYFMSNPETVLMHHDEPMILAHEHTTITEVRI